MAIAIVSGALANKPFNGGNAWTRLSWVTGLKQMGFDVLFIEQIAEADCVDAAGATTPFENSVNLSYFCEIMEWAGLTRSSALICDDGNKVHGLSVSEIAEQSSKADLLFNLSGHLTLTPVCRAARCKVYYDDDPGFTQFWHHQGDAGARLCGHDFYFTLGANIGQPECPIPVGDIFWRHTRPPVVLTEWPVSPPRRFDRFTTVASWRGAFGPMQYQGRTYGQKAHEFRKFITLPHRTGQAFEIALQIHPGDHKDLEALQANHWSIIDPRLVSESPLTFRDYVATSGAEFSVAQGIYVDTQSGWFSDRTVRYLASGRPVLVQDTGFSRHLPTGEGLLKFQNLDEAIEGAAAIVQDYPRQCRAARQIAEEYFDSSGVIGRLLNEIGIPSSPDLSVARPRPNRSAMLGS